LPQHGRLSGNPGVAARSFAGEAGGKAMEGGAVECLDLALFVDGQDNGLEGRVDVETDNVDELGCEPRIVQTLERAHSVRLKAVRIPGALHRTQKNSLVVAIARPVHCVAYYSGTAHITTTTPITVLAAIGGLLGLHVWSRSNPSTPSSVKRCCQRHTVGQLTPISAAMRFINAASGGIFAAAGRTGELSGRRCQSD